jgi:hypothetical protein
MSELKERYVIDSDQKAEWALQKIKEARADRDRWIAYYEEQIEKVKYSCDEDTANLECMLSEYFKMVPHKETKTQENYPLPSGKLVLKKQGPEYDHDDAILVPWLEANMPELVKVKKSSNWAELKNMVTIFDGGVVDENGEPVPGVTVTERPEKFVVEIKEAKKNDEV